MTSLVPTKTYHILNLGAGVQSTDLALSFEAGEIVYDGEPVILDAAIFADTQDETGDVYRHLDWLQRTIKRYPILIRTKGRLSDHLKTGTNSTGQRFASIPAYTKGPGDAREGQTRRQCSKEYKIEVIEKTIRRDIGGAAPGRPLPKNIRVVQYMGISMDEIGRAVRVMRNKVPKALKKDAERWPYARLVEFFSDKQWAFRFPLVDTDTTRSKCAARNKVRVPHETPRSACVYCPYHDDAEWLRIKAVPEDWAAALDVDRALRIPGNVVNRSMDKPLYLHRSCQPCS